MKTPSLPRELAGHLEAYCLGELTEDAARQLETLVTNDPAHRQHFVRFMMMHAAAIRLEAAGPEIVLPGLLAAEIAPGELAPLEAAELTELHRARSVRRQITWRRSLAWARLVAAVLFVAYFAGISWNILAKRQAAEKGVVVAGGEDPRAEHQQVAIVRDSENAVWKSPEAAPEDPQSEITNQKSEILPGTPLHLASGIVNVELRQGVTLLVEGPAEWTVDGENNATLHRGKVVAQVPPGAIGFSLDTPHGTIVDLGTEFGVEVSESGSTGVHVLVGKVEMQSGDRKTQPAANAARPRSQLLQAGESARVDAQGVRIVRNEALAEKFEQLSRAGERIGGHGPGYDVVFHYRFGADDPMAKAGQPAAERLLGQGEQGSRHPLLRVGQPCYAAGTPEDADKLSLDLSGGDEAAGYLGSDYTDLSMDAVVLEAWVRPRSVKTLAVAAYLGHPSYNGYGFILRDGKWALLYGGQTIVHAANADLDRWTHLAWVREVGRSVLFVNGQTSGPEHRSAPNPPTGTLYIGHAPGKLPQTFDGQIAEVRLIRLNKYFDPGMFLFDPQRKEIQRQ